MNNSTGTRDRQREKGAAATVCVGGLIATIGTFTPWITITQGSASASRTGLDWSGDAKWLIGLAALAALAAVAKVADWRLPYIIGSGVIIDGAIMMGLTIYDATQVMHRETVGQAAGLSVQIGAGLWLSLAGSAAVVVGGVALAGGLSGLWRTMLTPKPQPISRTYALGEKWAPDEKPSDSPPTVSS